MRVRPTPTPPPSARPPAPSHPKVHEILQRMIGIQKHAKSSNSVSYCSALGVEGYTRRVEPATPTPPAVTTPVPPPLISICSGCLSGCFVYGVAEPGGGVALAPVTGQVSTQAAFGSLES